MMMEGSFRRVSRDYLMLWRIRYLIFIDSENELYDHYKSILTSGCRYFIVIEESIWAIQGITVVKKL
jgi:hypothetical protein